MTKIIGKHRELLIELLIYYLNKNNPNVQFTDFINEENTAGRYWIRCYIDDNDALGKLAPQNNNPEHNDEENNDGNG